MTPRLREFEKGELPDWTVTEERERFETLKEIQLMYYEMDEFDEEPLYPDGNAELRSIRMADEHSQRAKTESLERYHTAVMLDVVRDLDNWNTLEFSPFDDYGSFYTDDIESLQDEVRDYNSIIDIDDLHREEGRIDFSTYAREHQEFKA